MTLTCLDLWPKHFAHDQVLVNATPDPPSYGPWLSFSVEKVYKYIFKPSGSS